MHTKTIMKFWTKSDITSKHLEILLAGHRAANLYGLPLNQPVYVEADQLSQAWCESEIRSCIHVAFVFSLEQ